MRHVIIAIRDAKALVFSPPYAYVSAGVAVRSFIDVVNDPKSDYHKHPEDYSIFQLGTYDDDTGTFQHEKPEPRQLMRADVAISYQNGQTPIALHTDGQ